MLKSKLKKKEKENRSPSCKRGPFYLMVGFYVITGQVTTV
jgi:hypothetical protein